MTPRKTRGESADVPLSRLPVTWDLEAPIPDRILGMLDHADRALQHYWDSWHRRPIEQYVACDFRDVWRALAYVHASGLAEGQLFCEWGCGFGIVTAMASWLGWDAIGIEAEPFLVEQAKQFLAEEKITAEIWHGNFLPRGSERLAKHQASHASLFHQVPVAYETRDVHVDDFSIVFAYPWPGEDGFLKEVFRTYANEGALLLLFLGPYELELYRKPESQ